MTDRSPDQNVEKLRELLLVRSQVGLAKYGVTTARDDLLTQDWLHHALEEALDLAVYLTAARSRADELEKKVKFLEGRVKELEEELEDRIDGVAGFF